MFSKQIYLFFLNENYDIILKKKKKSLIARAKHI